VAANRGPPSGGGLLQASAFPSTQIGDGGGGGLVSAWEGSLVGLLAAPANFRR